MLPNGYFYLHRRSVRAICSRTVTYESMHMEVSSVAEAKRLGERQAERFGSLVRERRKRLKMNQDELALATGVGRRFIIDLEAGKPSCELGRALLVAEAVGLRIFDLISHDVTDNALLPDLPDDEGLPS